MNEINGTKVSVTAKQKACDFFAAKIMIEDLDIMPSDFKNLTEKEQNDVVRHLEQFNDRACAMVSTIYNKLL